MRVRSAAGGPGRGGRPERAAPHETRILIVSTVFGGGGAQEQVKLLIRAFSARGHRVLWASLQDAGPFQAEVAALGVPAVSLGMRRGRADPRGILRLARAVGRFRPDVVHSHMVHANLLARLTRPVAAMPVLVCTAHSLYEGARWRELAYRASDPLCDLTTNVSRAAVARFVRVGAAPARKIRYVPNGIDLGRFAPRDEAHRSHARAPLGVGGRFVWLAAGRLAPEKDYPTLLRAFARVRCQDPQASLLLAGEGPERSALERLRAELGLPAGRVRFLGARKDVPRLMLAADACVLSSAWEGLPMVLLEAGAAGLPIVATDVGGTGEIVDSGASGLLVPPHDADALAAAMRRLMTLPAAERAAWGATGRRHVAREYGLERVADGWLALYRDLLARKPGVSRRLGAGA
ncbi:MAG TPA: glycosyltransferase [Trueperaceae bacterium]|nr:glycosyltransferase [Trueperaceae bacterium]